MQIQSRKNRCQFDQCSQPRDKYVASKQEATSSSLTDLKYVGGGYTGALNVNVRRQTAVDTAGVIGASFAVIEKNWICPDCGNENFARRQRCFRSSDLTVIWRHTPCIATCATIT